MHRLMTNASKIMVCIFATIVLASSTAWAGNGNDPGNGNTFGAISFNVASKDQIVSCTFSPEFTKTSSVELRFTDETTGSQHQTIPATADYTDGIWQFTMPALEQGHIYDVTATVDGMTYEMTGYQAPVDPGHQLPETRYAILFPLVLVALFAWRKYRSV